VGAPHIRRRIFVVAYADGERLREFKQRESSRSSGGVRDARQGVAVHDGAAERVANADRFRLEEWREGSGESKERPVASPSGWWNVEPEMGRVANGLSSGLAGSSTAVELTALGNAVVPQCAEVVGLVVRQILEEA
jgi:site-specific DNA-cytosine methylase